MVYDTTKPHYIHPHCMKFAILKRILPILVLLLNFLCQNKQIIKQHVWWDQLNFHLSRIVASSMDKTQYQTKAPNNNRRGKKGLLMEVLIKHFFSVCPAVKTTMDYLWSWCKISNWSFYKIKCSMKSWKSSKATSSEAS